MVIGLFRTPTAAALCLDNLYEADFGPQDISLVMKTKAEVEEIADVSGPWNCLPVAELPARLIGLGLSPPAADQYGEGVLKGGVFIAISAPVGEAAAAEMLKDHGAQDIRLVAAA